MTTAFSSVPVVDFGRLQSQSSESKQEELKRLHNAMFGVGFLYLTNTGLDALLKEAHKRVPEFFNIPPSLKEQCHMRNSPSFLGYTGLGAETTAAKTDIREQFDFGTPVPHKWTENDPFWLRLEGDSQYPTPALKAFIDRYTTSMEFLSRHFVRSVAESLSLPPTTFDPFIGHMSRMKLVKYPQAAPGSQGVGPHKDSIGLFTFLSQDSVGGLQVLNKAGDWIDAPYIEGSLVVNIAQGFEAITGGLCPATTHRVVSPVSKVRYSIPFFQAVKLSLTLDELKKSAKDIVARIPAKEEEKDGKSVGNDVISELISPEYCSFGEAQLRNRIFSHPDVGKEWYPYLLEKYGCNGATPQLITG